MESRLGSLISHTSPALGAEDAEVFPDPEEVDWEEIEVMAGPGVRVGSEEEKKDFPEEVDFRVKSLIKAQQPKDPEYLGKRWIRIKIDVSIAINQDISQQIALRKVRILVRTLQRAKSLRTIPMLMEVLKSPNWPQQQHYPRHTKTH